MHLPLYYEVVYHLSASEAGLALIPLAAISTCGAAIAGRTMARAKHYKRVAIIGTSCSALAGLVMALTTLPLWGLLVLLSVFALGLGTAFPVSVVSLQNSVARSQVGTVTGAMNFFRALMASFTVAAFSRHPADGAGRGHFARRRASRTGEFDSGRRHDQPHSATYSALPRRCWPPHRCA